ncbi:Transcriptional regulator, TetR family [Nocardiopsis sp. JB363]|nr:Transcriptional regulator, TetR family [Nocardiopsis sp. JB363]
MKTRDIGRSAVRDELARTAFPLFCDRGFDEVTFEELATVAGVSRSTFLRYFGSKEEVVLFSFDPLGAQMVEALLDRPAHEKDRTALRHALSPATGFLNRDPAEGLALLRLIGRTPALCARLREKQAGWRPGLARALAERPGARPGPDLRRQVLAGTALECLTVSLEHWASSEGDIDLDGLINDSFSALSD